ncbi:hypothetical protein Pint_14666 [Pistacia integerrima]|uniref:Uncharacterized protein n=1 Tax=Pistacia integerrima TaxID=434235 RepID=A0ACC0YBA7_9ROSI|nr:hypothetical protein Pint_14666 [Pistacia integerrima]
MSFHPSMAGKTIAFLLFLFIYLPHSNGARWLLGFSHTVKHKNLSVVTLLSIQGTGQNSSIFGSLINQSSSRKTFIKSSIETARLYGFHGLDLAGVKPSRTINMTNLGTLFDEWHDEVNFEARNSGAHVALYGSSSWFNTNYSISEWLRIGVEAEKLVLDGSIGYKFIKSYVRDYGYRAASVYNHTYVMNFFTTGTNWINFDGVEAIRAKVSYAKEKGLLGYNVFQLSNDDKWKLSSAGMELLFTC